MKHIRIGYIGLALALILLTLSCRDYLLTADTLKLRAEAFDFQQFVEGQQSQIAVKRQQLQVQQEKLTKGSAIGETIGPAVLKDIAALAEKPGNARLRELLQRHGVRVPAGASESVTPSAGQPARKGGN